MLKLPYITFIEFVCKVSLENYAILQSFMEFVNNALKFNIYRRHNML